VRRIKELLPLQVLRYELGQKYDPHFDYFFRKSDGLNLPFLYVSECGSLQGCGLPPLRKGSISLIWGFLRPLAGLQFL
jgi:hypothetical protein